MSRTFLLAGLLFLLPILLVGQAILQHPVSISRDSLPLSELLQEISTQTGAQFAYSKRKVPLNKRFSVEADGKSLQEVLDQLMPQSGLVYQVNDNQIALARKTLRIFTLSGYVRDASSGEVLIGANVYVSSKLIGTTTNEHGFYSLSLAEGEYIFNSSYVGYEEQMDTIALYADQQKEIQLSTGHALAEVLVLGSLYKPQTTLAEQANVGTSKIDGKAIANTPTLLGEKDVMKVAQLQPGVAFGFEGSSGLHVNGGSPDQNLILLDGVPLYNVSHLLGFISIFDGQAINAASVYSSGIPARYSGRLSSIMDVRMRDGNNQELRGGISMGLLSGNIYLEGPIKKGKSSFLITGRRTWLDILAASAQVGQQEIKANYKFQDVNMKLNVQVSPKDRLFLSTYGGKDRLFALFNFQTAIIDSVSNTSISGQDLEWGNQAYSLRWNRIINPKLFMNTSLIAGRFNYRLLINANTQRSNEETELEFDWNAATRINDYGIKSDFDYLPNPKHHVRFGFGFISHNFEPASLSVFTKTPTSEQTVVEGAPRVQGREAYLYLEDQFSLTRNLSLNAGFHLTYFNTDSVFYPLPQFRLRLKHQFTPQQSWQFSYSGMSQFIHLLRNNSIGLSTELWVPSTAEVKPSYAHQLALGYNWIGRSWYFKAEAYGKLMQNLIEYEDGASLINSTSNWEDRIVNGKGWSYGTAFSLKRQGPRLSAWLTYSLSWSNRRFDNINGGRVFPYKFDRRHNLNTGLSFDWKGKKGKQKSLNLIWILTSGHWVGLPVERYQSLDGRLIFSYPKRNGFRTPNYHRLDISRSTLKTTRRGNVRTWSWGFYNLYGQNNPIDFYVENIGPENTPRLVKQSLFPLPLPFVRYQFDF